MKFSFSVEVKEHLLTTPHVCPLPQRVPGSNSLSVKKMYGVDLFTFCKNFWSQRVTSKRPKMENKTISIGYQGWSITPHSDQWPIHSS